MTETNLNNENSLLATDQPIYSVSETTGRIATAIDNAFEGNSIWVRGEISNFRGRNQRGHIYLNLKDENAVLPCAFFARQNSSIDFELEEGMDVLASGRIDLYAPHGRYQLIINKLVPAGKGQLYIKFEQLKKKLTEEGLFAEERKQELPQIPEAIGIVTSTTGAVIRDIMSTLKRRFPFAPLFIAPAQVQGSDAAPTICHAIKKLHQIKNPAPSVIVIARGGGSIEDLWPFNEESVAREIANATIPVVSAVGHETDFTIADFVADLRAATPTQAAELIAPDRNELVQRLVFRAESVATPTLHLVDNARRSLIQIRKSPVFKFPEKMVSDRRQNIDSIVQSLIYTTDSLIARVKQQLTTPTSRLRSLNPKSVLKRGFALVENQADHLVTTTQQVTTNEQINVHLGHGSLVCRVEKKREEQTT